jgi:hypothetical protein
MYVPRISSWENLLLPKDEAFTMDLREKEEEGMLFPPGLSTPASPVPETSDNGGTGLRPSLLGGNSGSQPRTGE